MMLHFNVGHHLHHPYESRYAIARRFLIANPILNAQNLNQYLIKGHDLNNPAALLALILKLNFPEKIPDYLTLISQNPEDPEYESIVWQCAICAKQGYHTDLFRLPWIKNCPIHGSPLVKKCMICKAPWPGLHEILDRWCEGCGRSMWPSLSNIQAGNDNQERFAPIKALYQLIQYFSSQPWQVTFTEKGSTKLMYNAGIDHPDFPSLQISTLPKTAQSVFMKAGIQVAPSIIKTFNITPIDVDEMHEKFEERNSSTCTWVSEERLACLKFIHRWIKEHTVKGHQLRLFDYTVIKHYTLGEDPIPCPFCLSFSMWFFQALTYPMETYTPWHRINEYWRLFPHYYQLQSEMRPIIFFNNQQGEHFSTNTKFQRWMYQRCLQLFFFNALRYLLQLFVLSPAALLELSAYPANTESSALLKYHPENEIAFNTLSNNRLLIRYLFEPSDLISAQNGAQSIMTKCKAFKRFIENGPNFLPRGFG
jgi:hypothetical protein